MNCLDLLFECWLIIDDNNLSKKEKLKKVKKELEKYDNKNGNR